MQCEPWQTPNMYKLGGVEERGGAVNQHRHKFDIPGGYGASTPNPYMSLAQVHKVNETNYLDFSEEPSAASWDPQLTPVGEDKLSTEVAKHSCAAYKGIDARLEEGDNGRLEMGSPWPQPRQLNTNDIFEGDKDEMCDASDIFQQATSPDQNLFKR